MQIAWLQLRSVAVVAKSAAMSPHVAILWSQTLVSITKNESQNNTAPGWKRADQRMTKDLAFPDASQDFCVSLVKTLCPNIYYCIDKYNERSARL